MRTWAVILFIILLCASERDYGQSNTEFEKLNKEAWNIFIRSDDIVELKRALDLSNKTVGLDSSDYSQLNYNYLNTYANLLYKLGRIAEALESETKAFRLATGGERVYDVRSRKMLVGSFKIESMVTLFKMKRGLPTWPVKIGNYGKVSEKVDRPFWNEIHLLLVDSFTTTQADSMLYLAQLKYYKEAGQWPLYLKVRGAASDQYGDRRTDLEKNSDAWQVFLHCSKRRELKQALSWSRETLADEQNKNLYAFLDTYANLLYKLGKTSLAIDHETKALKLCPKQAKADYKATLDKMKSGKRTW